MRKLIRSKHTRKFLTREGGWTDSVSSGWDFEAHSELYAAKKQLNLEEVELYYSFDEFHPSEYDFTVPLFSAV